MRADGSWSVMRKRASVSPVGGETRNELPPRAAGHPAVRTDPVARSASMWQIRTRLTPERLVLDTEDRHGVAAWIGVWQAAAEAPWVYSGPVVRRLPRQT